jgi:hypothetical protein
MQDFPHQRSESVEASRIHDCLPQGKIEIYFTSAVNYPSVSAIEVIPE